MEPERFELIYQGRQGMVVMNARQYSYGMVRLKTGQEITVTASERRSLLRLEGQPFKDKLQEVNVNGSR